MVWRGICQSYQRQLGELEDEAARLEMLQTTNTAHKLAERTNTDLEPRNGTEFRIAPSPKLT